MNMLGHLISHIVAPTIQQLMKLLTEEVYCARCASRTAALSLATDMPALIASRMHLSS